MHNKNTHLLMFMAMTLTFATHPDDKIKKGLVRQTRVNATQATLHAAPTSTAQTATENSSTQHQNTLTPQAAIQTIKGCCFTNPTATTDTDFNPAPILSCLQQASQGNLMPAEDLKRDPDFYCYLFLWRCSNVLHNLEQRDRAIIKTTGYNFGSREFIQMRQAADNAAIRRSMAYQSILQHFINLNVSATQPLLPRQKSNSPIP